MPLQPGDIVADKNRVSLLYRVTEVKPDVYVARLCKYPLLPESYIFKSTTFRVVVSFAGVIHATQPKTR